MAFSLDGHDDVSRRREIFRHWATPQQLRGPAPRSTLRNTPCSVSINLCGGFGVCWFPAFGSRADWPLRWWRTYPFNLTFTLPGATGGGRADGKSAQRDTMQDPQRSPLIVLRIYTLPSPTAFRLADGANVHSFFSAPGALRSFLYS
jgi:hypothetical protein